MPTIYPFTPSNTSVFQFSPTLDNAIYQATTPWLLFGARFYLNLVAIDGTAIWYGAVVGSPDPFALSTISWANGRAYVTTTLPHGLQPATTVPLNVFGNVPTAFNGLFECFITGPSSFFFALSSDPGNATVIGSASQDLNLIGGVPNSNGVPFTNRLIFRQSSKQFEVW